jgi:hypothetical protein
MAAVVLPDDLLNRIRGRSNRKEQSRFPYRLWELLSWVGRDPTRVEAAGCGWQDANVFSINKPVLCEAMQIKENTLNVNLKELGFTRVSRSGKLSTWKHSAFSETESSVYFGCVRNVRSRPDSVAGLSVRAAYLPLLEPLELFLGPNFQQSVVNQFKCDVITQWEKLLQSEMTFAVPRDRFIDLLLHHITPSQTGPVDSELLKQVVESRIPRLVEALDFAKLMARFGPFRTLGEKLRHYQKVVQTFQPDPLFHPILPAHYFAATFHNCFSFAASQFCGEYHCYNLPYADSNSQYLVDEDDVVYDNWEQMLNRNPFLMDAM